MIIICANYIPMDNELKHPSEHLRFWTLNEFKFALSYLNIELIKVHSIPHNASLIKLNASLFSQSFVFEVKL